MTGQLFSTEPWSANRWAPETLSLDAAKDGSAKMMGIGIQRFIQFGLVTFYWLGHLTDTPRCSEHIPLTKGDAP